MKSHYLSETKWEETVGYSRAIKMGNNIEISGSTATNETGSVVGQNDAYQQTRQTLDNIRKALTYFGLDYSNIIRTRMYVTDISQWQEYGRAHGEIFHHSKPAISMVEVSALIDPEMMIEIEATAMIME